MVPGIELRPLTDHLTVTIRTVALQQPVQFLYGICPCPDSIQRAASGMRIVIAVDAQPDDNG
jgi:hypothetical protein